MLAPFDMHFELAGHVFRPGDHIDATLVVDASKDAKATLLVWLEVCAHGRGNTHRERGDSYIVFDGEVVAGTHRYPVSLPVPNGPFTYVGQTVNLTWYLRAQADVPWALDPNTEHEFVLEYEPNGLALAHVPKVDLVATEPYRALAQSKSQDVGTVFFVAGVIIFVIVFAVMITAVGVSGLPTVIFSAIFLGGVVLAFAHRFFRRKAAELRLGRVSLEVDPVSPSPGDDISVTLAMVPEQTTKFTSMICRIRATERVVRGSGTNRTTYTQEVFAEHIPFGDGPRQLQAGEECSFSCAASLPVEAPFSFDFPDNELEWTIEIVIDLPGWPDWVQSKSFNVLPSARALPSENLNPVATVAADAPDEGIW